MAGLVTAATIGGVATVAAAGIGAAGASGMFGGGGSGSATPVPLTRLRKIANQNVNRIRNEANTVLLPQIKRLSDDLIQKTDELVADGGRQLNDEEKALLDRLKANDTALTELQDSEDALLKEDLDALTNDLKQGMALLDATDKEEFNAALNSFNERAAELTADYDERASGVTREADTESLDTINRFNADSLSLGDRFAEQTNQALGKFESFISADNASQTLDTLTQSIFDTRQKLIAQADPRAKELAALVDENASAMLSGRISADMQANVARSSAMRALQGGFGASGQMGRGLTARDLGLTSLDLMEQGTKMYDDQRRLNYDTRVAGIENIALGQFGELRVGQESLMKNSLDAAQSDRDQRQDVFKTSLDSNLGRIGDRATRDLGIAGSVLQSGLETGRLGFDARRDNISERTTRNANNLTNIFDRNFVSRQSVYGENLNTGRSIYTTNANAAGNIFSTKADSILQNTGQRIGARNNAFTAGVNAQSRVFDTISGAIQGGSATLADATTANWANNNAWNASKATTTQNLWGSAINSGMTAFGNLASSVVNRKASNPYGFNNFDSGSGTGA
jgi:hypothetical protein